MAIRFLTDLAGTLQSIFRIQPSGSSGAPVADAHYVGEIAMDQDGLPWRCTVAGTPGTWVSMAGGGVTDHGALTGLTDDDHTQYVLVDGTRALTGDLIGKDFIRTRNGTITRDVNGFITSVALTGGRTLAVTRNASNYITSIADGARTYSYTRNASNQITSWGVA